jgi:flagellar biosynthesis/type III secretory pathway chaperone
MPSRAELGRALLEYLQDIAALLEQGRSAAVEEQKALVANDAEALVQACKAQEEILRRIADRDQLAADAASELCGLAGLDPDAADPVSVASAATPPYGERIADEMDRIGALADALQKEHETNRTLLENGIEIVACCLRTLASDPGPSSYSKDGGTAEAQPFVLSLDKRA